jgi:DNA-binding IscR family transcriptional regulator
MRLSTKTRYAVRALIELALKGGDGPVKLFRRARIFP